MNVSERDYIALCKQRIEEKLHLKKENGTLRQRDLEYLADCIEEKSGIRLSLSTLKRLWKQDYDQTPHPSTLQALVSVLEYNDWQEFKRRETLNQAVTEARQGNQTDWSSKRWMILALVVALPVLIWLIAFRSGKPEKVKLLLKGPVTFTGNKTVAQGVPSTIIFNYDVSNAEADSFFFQQSWNPLEKVKLDPKGHHYSNIYYYPGFHKAKLIANDSILKRFRIHITTDGWMPLIRYSYQDNMPIYLKKANPVVNGALHITRKELASSNVNLEKDFVQSYYNIREFGNTYSDNFTIDTRVVCDSVNTIVCPGFELVIVCEEHIFFVRMMKKGCERDIGIKMGEVVHDGSKNDLSVFGRDMHQWQRLQVQVVDKRAKIILDEQTVYTIDFKKDFGKVVGLVYNFTGTGAIDYVKLKNGNNEIVYESDFED
jgi:hypothetical protein